MNKENLFHINFIKYFSEALAIVDLKNDYSESEQLMVTVENYRYLISSSVDWSGKTIKIKTNLAPLVNKLGLMLPVEERTVTVPEHGQLSEEETMEMVRPTAVMIMENHDIYVASYTKKMEIIQNKSSLKKHFHEYDQTTNKLTVTLKNLSLEEIDSLVLLLKPYLDEDF